MPLKEKFIPRVKIFNVQEIELSTNSLVNKLLSISQAETVCLLDSCGVNHLNSHQLVAGINPLEVLEIQNNNADETLHILDKKVSNPNVAGIFTISYDLGLKLENLKQREKEYFSFQEPDIFLAIFDCLIIHDYNTRKTFLKGNINKFSEINEKIINIKSLNLINTFDKSVVESNFTTNEYINAINQIKEYIRAGDTYQTNLTQQFRAKLTNDLNAQIIFHRLRNNHPAPFASFLKRKKDYVVSISPERFFKTENSKNHRKISTSPIKGTRPRGKNLAEDSQLKKDLLGSQKDRAENTMIVDLLRNDLGRISEFGSVNVEKLCDLETHPSIFHLVSTISGNLREKATISDLIKATFPCGSITGCPKIRTMEIINELETANRGLSMGAIGYCDFDNSVDLSVAIRTMVIRDQEAIFNVGGGIVIDSDAYEEYQESLDKAKAIFEAINADFVSD